MFLTLILETAEKDSGKSKDIREHIHSAIQVTFVNILKLSSSKHYNYTDLTIRSDTG